MTGRPPVHTLMPASASARSPFAQRPVLSLGRCGVAQTLAKVAKLNAVKQQLWGLELAAPAAVGAGITGKSPFSASAALKQGHLMCCNEGWCKDQRLLQRAVCTQQRLLEAPHVTASSGCCCREGSCLTPAGADTQGLHVST